MVPSDCDLIIEERTSFDPDTACPLNLGVKRKKPSPNERYGSSERAQGCCEEEIRLILSDTRCPPRGKIFSIFVALTDMSVLSDCVCSRISVA